MGRHAVTARTVTVRSFLVRQGKPCRSIRLSRVLCRADIQQEIRRRKLRDIGKLHSRTDLIRPSGNRSVIDAVRQQAGRTYKHIRFHAVIAEFFSSSYAELTVCLLVLLSQDFR